MAVKYWFKALNGSDNWSTTSNWYNGSGGTGGLTTVPTSADDVIFDFNSGTGVVTLSTTSTCNSFNATEFRGTLAGAGAFNITNQSTRGASSSTPLFAFGANMTVSSTGTVTFGGTTGQGGWIFCNGKTFRGAVTFNNTTVGATFTLKDTFGTLLGGAGLLLTLTSGRLIAEADVIVGRFSSTAGVRTFTCSNLYLTGTGTLTAATATTGSLTTTIQNIYVTDNSVTTKTLTFNTLFGSTNVDFGGTSSGTMILIPGVTFQPNVLVSNTGSAVFNISTAGTIKNLIFSETSNVNWNNTAVIITSNGTVFTMVGGITVTNTPSLVFSGPSTITTAGKNLVTGTLTTNGATTIVGAFSSNAGVTINGAITDLVNFDSTFLSGSLTINGANCVFTNTLRSGAITMNSSGINTGQIEVYGNVSCTGTTTISGGGTLYYQEKFTSNAITLNFGTITAYGSLDVDQTITCTNVFTFTRGVLDNTGSYQSSPINIGSIIVSGTEQKGLNTNDLFLTGAGTLFTPGTATNLSVSIVNIYVTNGIAVAKTLSLTNMFGAPNVYLRGSNSITFGGGTGFLPIVYVEDSVGGFGVVSFLTGTLTSLIFSPGTNAVWNNAASQVLTIDGGELTMTSSMSISTLTPSLNFISSSGYEPQVTMAGKSLIGGSLTSDACVTNIIDNFNSNIPVLVTNGGTLNTKGFLTTGLLTVSGTFNANTSPFSVGSLSLLDAVLNLNTSSNTVTGAVTVSGGTNNISGLSISVGGTLLVTGGSLLDTNISLTVVGLTTISGGSTLYLYSSNLFSALTITSGLLNTGGGVDYICTGVTTLTEGDFGNTGNYYTGSLSTNGSSLTKNIYANILFFTGSGTLYTPSTGVILSYGPDQIEIVGSSALAKTLTLGVQFPLTTNLNVYLGGSGSGSITVTPGSTWVPNIIVTNTGGSVISIGSGIINDLQFLNISNAVWNNGAVTLQVQGALSFGPTSSATIVSTPTLSFNYGGSSGITLYGRSLTAPVSVTLASYVAVTTDFVSTSTIAVTDGTLDVYSSNFTATTLTTSLNGSTVIRNGNVNLTTLTTAGAFAHITGNLTVTGIITVTGQFSTSGNVNITCTSVSVSGANSTISISSRTIIILTGTGTVWSAPTNANSIQVLGVIKIIDTSLANITFAGGNWSYYDLIFDRGTSPNNNAITGSNYFTNLRDWGTAAHFLIFPSSGVTTLGNLDVHGSPGNRISITRSSTTGTLLQKSPAGLVTLDYVDITNVPANEVNTFYAGPNSTVTTSANWINEGKVRKQSALGVG